MSNPPSAADFANAIRPLFDNLNNRLVKIETIVTADLQSDTRDNNNDNEANTRMAFLAATIQKISSQIDIIQNQLNEIANDNKLFKEQIQQFQKDYMH